MMKHKVLSIFLCLLLTLPLSACNRSDQPKNTQPSDPSPTAATTVPSPELPPETKPDPLQNEKNAIKEEVLVFMADDVEDNDPSAMFERFLGNYAVTDFSNAYEDSIPYNSIYQKDGVSVIDRTDGTVYTIATPNQIVTAKMNGGKLAVLNQSVVESAPVPSIFSDFGFDISTVYSENDSTDFTNLDLTPDMLSVSDDLQTCNFSAEYMNRMSVLFAESLELDQPETQAFMDSCQASGSYSVEAKRAVFTVSGSTTALGAVRFTVTLTHNPDFQDYSSVMKVEYTMNVSGAPVSVTNELTIQDNRYSGGYIHGFFFRNILTAETTVMQNGIPVSSKSVTTSMYSIKANGDFHASQQIEQEVSAMGQSSSEDSYRQLQFDSNSAEGFSYSEEINGILQLRLIARSCQFGEHDLTIPQAVIDLKNQLNGQSSTILE